MYTRSFVLTDSWMCLTQHLYNVLHILQHFLNSWFCPHQTSCCDQDSTIIIITMYIYRARYNFTTFLSLQLILYTCNFVQTAVCDWDSAYTTYYNFTTFLNADSVHTKLRTDSWVWWKQHLYNVLRILQNFKHFYFYSWFCTHGTLCWQLDVIKTAPV